MSNARNLANNLAALVAAETPVQGATGSRNLIINGSMQVWQRGAGTTTISNSTYPTVMMIDYFLKKNVIVIEFTTVNVIVTALCITSHAANVARINHAAPEESIITG